MLLYGPISDRMPSQFHKLIENLLRGKLDRHAFERWEIELLLEVEACRLPKSKRDRALRSYRSFVLRQIESGCTRLAGFAEYLAERGQKRRLPQAGASSSAFEAARVFVPPPQAALMSTVAC
ncbi:MAG: hypothetical protein HYS04_04110 [Acidobacteria bacterium]|nr:hypothetical protein [Acidobacteriota bacterium]